MLALLFLHGSLIWCIYWISSLTFICFVVLTCTKCLFKKPRSNSNLFSPETCLLCRNRQCEQVFDTDDSDDHTPGMSWSDLCQSWSLFHCQSTALIFSSLSIKHCSKSNAGVVEVFEDRKSSRQHLECLQLEHVRKRKCVSSVQGLDAACLNDFISIK